jgi:hypothetical protein
MDYYDPREAPWWVRVVASGWHSQNFVSRAFFFLLLCVWG